MPQSVLELFSASYFLLYLVVVALARRTADKVADESREKQLRTNHHRREGDIEPRRVCYQVVVDAVRQVNQLAYAYGNHREETDEEHYRTEESEHVHRLLAEAAEEPQRDKVEIAVYETVEAELPAFFAR